MKKYLVVSIVSLLALIVCVLTPTTALAAPADPVHGNLCFVQDANLVEYTVTCTFLTVYKTDENGNYIAVLNYQDKAQLPPEATLPKKAFHTIVHVEGHDIFDGDYAITVTPSGHYQSHGPINNN